MKITGEMIAVDMDHVLFPFNDALSRHVRNEYGLDVPPEAFTSMSFNIPMGITHQEGVVVIGDFIGSGDYMDVSPIEGAVEAIARLAITNRLYVSTSRSPSFKDITADYVDRYFENKFETVIASGNEEDGGPYVSKLRVAVDRGADGIIDDSVSTTTAFAQAGLRAIRYGQYPWQEQAADERHPNLHRLSNWQELLDSAQLAA
jgi:hypothetical protein